MPLVTLNDRASPLLNEKTREDFHGFCFYFELFPPDAGLSAFLACTLLKNIF